jgi:hypothetical protein
MSEPINQRYLLDKTGLIFVESVIFDFTNLFVVLVTKLSSVKPSFIFLFECLQIVNFYTNLINFRGHDCYFPGEDFEAVKMKY